MIVHGGGGLAETARIDFDNEILSRISSLRHAHQPPMNFSGLASALDNLLSGQVDWRSTGLDPSKADLPDEIGQWTFVGR